MNQLTKKWSAFKNSRFSQIVNRVIICKYFPFLSTAISLVCFYTGFDLLGFYNLAITTALICIFADDLNSGLIPILFLTVLPSKKSTTISDAYTCTVDYACFVSCFSSCVSVRFNDRQEKIQTDSGILRFMLFKCCLYFKRGFQR